MASGWWSATGRAEASCVTVGSGTVPIRAPRVNDKRVCEETGKRKRFSPRILPAYARRSPKVTEVLPIRTRTDSRPGTSGWRFGTCSARTRRTCRRARSSGRPSSGRPSTPRSAPGSCYAYLFVDGVNVSVRLGEDPKLCLLVAIGLREDGDKQLLAVAGLVRAALRSHAVS